MQYEIDDKSLIKLAENVPDSKGIRNELSKRVFEQTMLIITSTPDWGVDIYVIRNDFPDLEINNKNTYMFVSSNVDIGKIPLKKKNVVTLDDKISAEIILTLGLSQDSPVVVNITENEFTSIDFEETPETEAYIRARVHLETGFVDLVKAMEEYSLN